MTEYHSISELKPMAEANWIIKVQVARKWKDFNHAFQRHCGLNIILIDQHVSSPPLNAYNTFQILQDLCITTNCHVHFLQQLRNNVYMLGLILI